MMSTVKCCDVSVVTGGDTGTQRLLESGSLCVFGSSVYVPVPPVGKSRGISIRPGPTAELVWHGDSVFLRASKASQTLLRINSSSGLPQVGSRRGPTQVYSGSGPPQMLTTHFAMVLSWSSDARSSLSVGH